MEGWSDGLMDDGERIMERWKMCGIVDESLPRRSLLSAIPHSIPPFIILLWNSKSACAGILPARRGWRAGGRGRRIGCRVRRWAIVESRPPCHGSGTRRRPARRRLVRGQAAAGFDREREYRRVGRSRRCTESGRVQSGEARQMDAGRADEEVGRGRLFLPAGGLGGFEFEPGDRSALVSLAAAVGADAS